MYITGQRDGKTTELRADMKMKKPPITGKRDGNTIEDRADKNIEHRPDKG